MAVKGVAVVMAKTALPTYIECGPPHKPSAHQAPRTDRQGAECVEGDRFFSLPVGATLEQG